MENVIKTIVQMDKRAREMEAQEEQEVLNAKKALEERKQELYDHYAESEEEVIELTQAQVDEELGKKKKVVDESMGALSKALDDTCEKHRIQWVDKIVAEVTGE